MKNSIPNIDEIIMTSPKKLNINKIKDLEDVKRILEFMDIKAIDDGRLISHGFEKVKDLFD